MKYIVLCGIDSCKRVQSRECSLQRAKCSLQRVWKKNNVIPPFNVKCLLFQISLGERDQNIYIYSMFVFEFNW